MAQHLSEDRDPGRDEVRSHPCGVDLEGARLSRRRPRREFAEERLQQDRREDGVARPEIRRLAGCPGLDAPEDAQVAGEERLDRSPE